MVSDIHVCSYCYLLAGHALDRFSLIFVVAWPTFVLRVQRPLRHLLQNLGTITILYQPQSDRVADLVYQYCVIVLERRRTPFDLFQ